MILTKNSILDGQLSFEGGVDTYRAPSRVPRNQCCLLVNNTTRQDYIGSRPGWKQVGLTFANGDLQAAFEDGYFQGFHGYVLDSGKAHLVWSISGKIYKVDPLGSGSVQDLTPKLADNTTPDPNPSKRPIAWFAQGECFLIIQDGQSKPIIYDGAKTRRSDTTGSSGSDADGKPLVEVPVGTAMAYSGGRLWVGIDDGRHFVASDGVYGPTGTAAYNSRDSILKFTENEYLSGGGAFAVPNNLGQIRAIVPLANLDTSLGEGALQVFTTGGCVSIQAPFDRAAWVTTTDPIKTVSLIGQGALSQRGCVLVNGDVWYRGQDGVRSFIIARRDFGNWGNRSMSYEVIRHLQDDNAYLLDRQSAALFDNRLLCTCNPMFDQSHGVYHRGLVVLDFIPLTSLSGSQPPCWDGLWTGPDILQIHTVQSEGVFHCYAAVLAQPNSQGQRKIQLWELTTNQVVDQSLTVTARIPRIIESPKLDFQSKVEQKLLEACELWVNKIQGKLDFNLYYRPNEHACWLFWKSWSLCATSQRCSGDAVNDCQPAMNLREQFRARVGAQRPPEYVIPGTNEPGRLGYTFQIRLEILGWGEVMGSRLLANRIVEASFAPPANFTCEEVVCCEPTDFVASSLTQGGGTTTPGGNPIIIPGDGGGTWITTETGTPITTEDDTKLIPEGTTPPPSVQDPGLTGLDGGPAGDPPLPTVTIPPGPFEVPIADQWAGVFGEWGSDYIVYADPNNNDNLLADMGDNGQSKVAFWKQLLVNEWNNNPDHPTGWSQVVFGWVEKTPEGSNLIDFQWKYSTGDTTPHPDDIVTHKIDVHPYWYLAIFYR